MAAEFLDRGKLFPNKTFFNAAEVEDLGRFQYTIYVHVIIGKSFQEKPIEMTGRSLLAFLIDLEYESHR